MSKNERDLSKRGNASFDLSRFVKAQSSIYDIALAEIRAQRKRTHWMWYIFPQLRGLGASEASRYYGIDGIVEAREYLAHPLLGFRLIECTQAMNSSPGSDALKILGAIDSQKFQSCITLFARVALEEDCFKRAIEQFFSGACDQRTIRRIDQMA